MKLQSNIEKVMRKLEFGLARGLTRAAQAAQEASIEDLKSTFTLRKPWFQKSNKFGIKIKAARVGEDMIASVFTRADWLELHETGGTKKGKGGGRIPIPTATALPDKSKLLSSKVFVKNLKKKFELKTDAGTFLATRDKKRTRKGQSKGGLKVLYNLEATAQIKKQSTFFEPIEKTVKSKGVQLIAESMKDALKFS